MQRHIERYAFLIFLKNTNGKAEAYDHEIDFRAICRQRCNPSTFARALESHAVHARSRKTARSHHRLDGVGREQVEILGVHAARRTRPAFIVDERGDTLRGKHSLKRIELSGRVMLRAMKEYHERHVSVALWHYETARHLDSVAFKRRVRNIEGDTFSGCATKRNCAVFAVGE